MAWLSLFPQDHSLPRRELRLDIQIGDLLTPIIKTSGRTSHDRRLHSVCPLARGGLIGDKNVAAAWAILGGLVSLSQALLSSRLPEIHVFFFFDFADLSLSDHVIPATN
ncbi:hypothetical protein MJ568_02955 [Escherichia coli]|nr:hypothetical protein MJ568_02955 [Escherichia coli]